VRLRAGLAAGIALAAVVALPPVAEAHGLVGRTDLPIPSWLFGWAAAIVLAASFAALSALWREPRLQDPRERRLFRAPDVLFVPTGLIGIFFFVVVVYAGLKGVKTPTANLAPTAVYVVLWVGGPVAGVLFGDVFRAFNPWRSVASGVRWLSRGHGWRARPYPEWLGRWPAAIGILVFAWIELNYVHKTDPDKLAIMAIAYAVAMIAGMAVFGIETWSERADPFGVYFNLFSRLSVFERRDAVLNLRPPLSGAPRMPVMAGSTALLVVAIGTTTFDGFSNGPVWASLGPDLTDLFGGGTNGIELGGTVGLLGCVAVIGGFYRLGIKGMKTVGGGHTERELSRSFAHTLIPIAFAYLLAHYFSLLVYQGQALKYLISDPLGDGSNLFGTANQGIDYSVISSTGIWYVQVAALVIGHVSGLTLAHDRALSIYSNVRQATRSQYWMLVVMVGFTSLGLWLLSVIGAR
jgi:predicted outer membrane lipoprotein